MKASPEQAERLHTFAHDLRNRLIGLQQVLAQLKEAPPTEDRAELALYGEQQYFKALREVERLMDDLGVERGTVSPVVRNTALAPLIRQRVELMNFRAERKQQNVVLDLDKSVTVKIDDRIIGDLVDALLSNAFKFSPGGTAIHITLSGANGHGVLKIQDHGTGLSPSDLDQVFTRFAWLNNRPTAGESQGRGTLARARDWARAHNGELTAASSGEGHGCTFTLCLPQASE